MGLQGYVGSAADQARIRQLEKEREQDKERIEAAKEASASAPSGFRSWQKGETAVVERVFKQETIGLVSREKYIEKKSTIQARLEVWKTVDDVPLVPGTHNTVVSYCDPTDG